MTDGRARRGGRASEGGGEDSRGAEGSRGSGADGTTLAPLAFLQNQRRGSITVLSDPSLHAAGSGSGFYHNINQTAPGRPPLALPHSDLPAAGRLFDSSQRADTHIPLKRSANQPQGSHAAGGLGPSFLSMDRAEHQASMLLDEHDTQSALGQDARQHQSILHPPQPEPTLSPTSYAASGSHGTKRKMSIENVAFPHSGVEIDPQLIGPGGGMNVDSPDAPSLKRRGSVAATQNMAHLSLHDRRNSLDSRSGGAPSGSPWWTTNERRDPNAPSPGVFPGQYPPAFPADSPHGRPPGGMATFAWPAGPPPGAPLMQGEMDPQMQGPPFRPFDPSAPPTMPPVTFAHDRRMSAPGGMASPTMAATGRTLRSRSRPESRASEHASGSGLGGETGQPGQAPAGDGDDSASSSGMHPPKTGSGSTPYSRSPELRVSHKLAERKRRKEMKDLFDELRDHLPADRGMKASKWEILSKAVEFISQMKRTQQDMGREIEMLRHELDAARSGMPFVPGGPSHPGVGAFPPPHMMAYPGGPAPGPPMHSGPAPGPPMHPGAPPQHQPPSRPGSSHGGQVPPASGGPGTGTEETATG